MNIVHQYSEMVKFGSPPIWSGAIYELRRSVAELDADHVLVGDWGIEHQLVFLSNNRLPLSSVPHAGPEDVGAMDSTVAALQRPNTILVRYASVDLSPAPMRHYLADQAAVTAGVQLQLLETIDDRQRRAVFHIYSVSPLPASE